MWKFSTEKVASHETAIKRGNYQEKDRHAIKLSSSEEITYAFNGEPFTCERI